MKILVFGNGAREHAIVKSLKKTSGTYVCAICERENPGIKKDADEIRIKTIKEQLSITFDENDHFDLAIIGPEIPLGMGLADHLTKLGIPPVGPTKDLARLETSKVFAREFIGKSGIAGNPRFFICKSPNDVTEAAKILGDFAVKPDGLTGGKGVKVVGDHMDTQEGARYAQELLEKDGVVIVEEKLAGHEFSLQAFVSGESIQFMPLVRDFKRAYEDDKGPNTGSMGSYSRPDHQLSHVKQSHMKKAQSIMKNTVTQLMDTHGEYKGILYGQFMIANDQVFLIEFNVRFGDPEAMNVLELLETPLTQVCTQIVSGSLSKVEFKKEATTVVYLVPTGYPENPTKDAKINIPESILDDIYFASVYQDGPDIRTTGSRALAAFAKATSVTDASKRAYKIAKKVDGRIRFRSDIGN